MAADVGRSRFTYGFLFEKAFLGTIEASNRSASPMGILHEGGRASGCSRESRRLSLAQLTQDAKAHIAKQSPHGEQPVLYTRTELWSPGAATQGRPPSALLPDYTPGSGGQVISIICFCPNSLFLSLRGGLTGGEGSP